MLYFKRSNTLYLLFFLFMFIVIFCGCSTEKMSQRNYDKIQKGMTLFEVDKIMGFDVEDTFEIGPLYKSDNIIRMIYRHKDDPFSIHHVDYFIAEEKKSISVKINIYNGKVVAKECSGL